MIPDFRFSICLGDYRTEPLRHGGTEREAGKITNDTNQEIVQIILNIRD